MFSGGAGRGSYGYQRSRGRGGRFLSSSRGGRGRGAASNKWVRPTGETHDLSAAKTNETSKQQEEGVSDGHDGDSSKQPAKVNSSAPVAPPKLTAILKGPKRYHKGPAKSHTWTRPRDETTNATTEMPEEERKMKAAASVAAKSESQVPDKNNEDSKQPSVSQPAAQPSSMFRRGKHKLVAPHLNNETLGTTMPRAEKIGAASVPVEKGEEEHALSTAPMKKQGRNKLVLAKNDGGPSEESKERPTAVNEASLRQTGFSGRDDETANNTHAVLARKGNNKLVMQGANNGDGSRGTWDKYNPSQLHSSRGRGRGKRIASGRGVKRIKLNASEEDTGEVVEGDGEAGFDAAELEPSQTAAEKYTEFAYRQSSTVSHRGRGRGRSTMRGGRGGASNARGRNMGLVRVEPDAATTRMCPTYLRGEPCTNPKCTKRHDVPKEAAIPICSFFQRNGQCKKGDACQFRHIKVNPHATVCPSFSLLGFCENKDCIMKHVRAPKKRPSA